jgi:hypothetical protein
MALPKKIYRKVEKVKKEGKKAAVLLLENLRNN